MIARVQAHLEAIYGFTCEARAEVFLVDTEAAVLLGSSGGLEEELLVYEGDGEVELALYLAPALLSRLRPYESAPVNALLDGELDGFCQLAEGVSHFVYMAQTALQERTVSLLELEAQAEVDKFALCPLQRWGTGVEGWARELRGRLFERVSYRTRLTEAERWRYQEANRLSRNFCSRLMGHVVGRRLERLLSELRYAYRLGAEAKLRHFAQVS